MQNDKKEVAKLPTHIGYILDGNRRWAKQHGIPTYEGHLAGYAAVKDIVFDTIQRGVPYVSVYAFSTENWKRDKDEVDKLMGLTLRVAKTDIKEFIKNNVRVKFMGSLAGLSDKLTEAIDSAEKRTANLTGGTVCVCFNYGGQQEIVNAVREIVREGLDPEEIDEQVIANHLYVPEVPPVDIVVRTSGEQRLSNFMLWRSAYSEFLFLNKYWPDMTKYDVAAILEEYARRKRRFGG